MDDIRILLVQQWSLQFYGYDFGGIVVFHMFCYFHGKEFIFIWDGGVVVH